MIINKNKTLNTKINIKILVKLLYISNIFKFNEFNFLLPANLKIKELFLFE